jgi:pantoate--beta-alanine ligase
MSLAVLRSVAAVRAAVAQARRSGASVGLVPTMGALHAGHGSLIDQARQETGCVVVSIFVNPIQFDRRGDFDHYPRTLEGDLAFCRARRVDLVFAPEEEEMYHGAQHAFVEVTGLTEHLCGRFRPGHFRGVATVVLKLLNIVQPDRAYFGQKDAQQLAVIRRLIRDLNVPVEIVAVPTVREPDGLAISSRNRRLTPEQREAAPVLYQALLVAQQLIWAGAAAPAQVKAAAEAVLERQPSVRVEYLEIVDPEEIQPVSRISGPALVAAAIWLDAIRLIDNVLCEPGR